MVSPISFSEPVSVSCFGFSSLKSNSASGAETSAMMIHEKIHMSDFRDFGL